MTQLPDSAGTREAAVADCLADHVLESICLLSADVWGRQLVAAFNKLAKPRPEILNCPRVARPGGWPKRMDSLLQPGAHQML